MQVVFSMDGIKNMDLLYTWTEELCPELGIVGKVEHYHGETYCKTVIGALTDWKEKNYVGCRERIANETFILISAADIEYNVSFGINTFGTKSGQKNS